ncbi:MAG: tRNA lysidine(34) synthetase TilS [Methylomonas sp.]|nr:tRNA lysidine(34) synthetase TilS [Methylomonas sp.]PPD19993.1 MAG: tRNA lysidine(34) synthetase TilS [Methylomonas sp.]PPD26535.1 MAG: tRNA lysidine(34) synthetase TilS [Methylomonas sp.]PPD36976.1 MAG: tRNA lysidine(34) synthetase TilS [Methylomonas sp.]PPD38302.1 MAG: tRNA lysidine(34) synthetase TilS [Methylomonas sp.]
MLHFDDIADSLPDEASTLWLAYSGGIDSQVLLHLLASQPGLKPRMVAVYVDHGLQAESALWREHCRCQAEALGVAFRAIGVDARPKPGESTEAAAREARYRVLRPLLRPGDVLLVAQHREDQMETLLLQLLRGAGVQGLAAMPVSADFGSGRIVRPLLAIGKADIESYAKHHDLSWVTDPSNQSRAFDRNFLRHDIIPLLKQRWPMLDKTVARSARHCAEAALLLDRLTEKPFDAAFDADNRTLAIDALMPLSPAEQTLLLRKWLHHCTGKTPSEVMLRRVRHELIDARSDANPDIAFNHHQLKRYRNQLYCLPESALQPLRDSVIWPRDQHDLALPNGLTLIRDRVENGISARLWQCLPVSIRPRQGGETLKLPGRAGHHRLKKLFQEAGVPPWQREARPLIYLGDRLAAVVGLWVDEWAWNTSPERGISVRWQFRNEENTHVDGA